MAGICGAHPFTLRERGRQGLRAQPEGAVMAVASTAVRSLCSASTRVGAQAGSPRGPRGSCSHGVETDGEEGAVDPGRLERERPGDLVGGEGRGRKAFPEAVALGPGPCKKAEMARRSSGCSWEGVPAADTHRLL